MLSWCRRFWGFGVFNLVTALSSNLVLTLGVRFLAGMAAGVVWGVACRVRTQDVAPLTCRGGPLRLPPSDSRSRWQSAFRWGRGSGPWPIGASSSP